MRFKGGPHENPARGVVTIFLPKSAHAHPNSNNPPGRRDLAAITIAGGASSRSSRSSRAAAATERFTIYRRVQGGKCAGPDVEAAGCIRSLVATAHKRHKRRSKAAHWLPLPHDRGDDGAKPKAQRTWGTTRGTGFRTHPYPTRTPPVPHPYPTRGNLREVVPHPYPNRTPPVPQPYPNWVSQ